ncbi:hypothetical protein [Bosea sp. RAC05]|uniref:hypothetical protein n=1 Tax=Bosea sp. RAC05 TaxID=1842539 RepID=UPI00083DB545|nr:hypothetical protein [Bosea sp. RAC05]AOG03408.1 hypothetical protein BSY19_5003 [Bosea sp. RAC05]
MAPTEAQFAAALAHIAKLNRALGLDPTKDPILTAHNPEPVSSEAAAAEGVPLPVALAARDLVSDMKRVLAKVEAKQRDHQDRIDRYTRMRDSAVDDSQRMETQGYIDDLTGPSGETLAAFSDHERHLRSKIARLESEPLSMFLPLGTVVRFTDVPSHVNSLGIIQESNDRAYPVPGSIGVVTRLNHKGEYPISVTMRRPYKDGYGDRVVPDYDRMPTYFVDPQKVEVIGPGMLPGGRPCEAYGYVGTHHRESDTVSEREDEMIVEADGFFWRFHDFGGTQAMEALQAYESIEEMSWVREPLDFDDGDAIALSCPGV